MKPRFPHKKERKTQSAGIRIEMVVETLEVEVDHGVGGLVFHTKDHGFLCRLRETTTALVVMTLVEVVVLVQMAH